MPAPQAFGLNNQITYPFEMDVAYPGLPVESISVMGYSNAALDKPQTVLLKLGVVTADVNTLFEVNLGPDYGKFSYRSDATPVNTEIVNGLIAALYNAPAAYGAVKAEKTANADEILLTARHIDQTLSATFTGGANVTLTNTPKVESTDIPYGIVAVSKPTYPFLSGLQTITAPTATGDTEVGITLGHYAIPRSGDVPYGGKGQYRPNDPVDVMRHGKIWALTDEALTTSDTVLYRISATGSQVLGALGKTAGASRRSPTRIKLSVLRPTVTLSDGVMVTLVDVLPN